MDEQKKLVILTGPTAVGKTELSIKLAKRINGEIISADSIQVYREFDIGSAKITRDEMQGITHYLIDVLSPADSFNVSNFKELACSAMQEIYAKGKIPIIAGGTGFYIQAVLKDIDFTPVEDDGYRYELEALCEKNGVDYMYDMLKEIDPEGAAAIDKNNVKRVIRAIEFFHQTGEKISEHNKREAKKLSPYNYAYFVLNCDRNKLYERIDKRVDLMIENGLVNEVTYLKDKYNLTDEMTSAQGLGYKEILRYLNGEMSLEEAIYIIKRDTRHFAKRQLTWFKREKDVIWVDKDSLFDTEEQLSFIMEHLKTRGII